MEGGSGGRYEIPGTSSRTPYRHAVGAPLSALSPVRHAACSVAGMPIFSGVVSEAGDGFIMLGTGTEWVAQDVRGRASRCP